MNTNDFSSEVNQYIEQCFFKSIKYKEILKELLVVFDKICLQNDIQYFLLFGSLLGAIRDKQLIPWDIDIDVGIFYKDKEKLLHLLDTILPPDFYYVYEKTSKHPIFAIRISKKGYNIDVLHLDIFYICFAPDNPRQQLKTQRKIKKLYKNRFYINLYKKGNSKSEKLINFLNRLKCLNYNTRNIDKKCNAIAKKYNSTNNLIIFCENTSIFSFNIFKNSVRYKFDNLEVNIPCDFLSFLKIVYGKWEEYLNISSRFSEFLSGVNRIR